MVGAGPTQLDAVAVRPRWDEAEVTDRHTTEGLRLHDWVLAVLVAAEEGHFFI